MATLTLNGWTVPVVQASSKPEEVGSRETAVDGTELRIGTGEKRVATYKTIEPTTYAAASTLVSLLQGKADRWRFTDAYSDQGRAPATGSVYSLRPSEGYLTGSTAVAVETGTTNLIASGSAGSLTFGGSWAAQGGAAVTLTQGQTLTYNGQTINTGATRIQTSGGSSVAKIRFNAGTGTAATPLSCSAWIKNQGSGSVLIFDSFGNAFTVAAGQTAWAKTAKSSVDGVTNRLMDFRTATVSDSMAVIAWAPQMEVQYQATTFTSGTRASGVLGYSQVARPWNEFTFAAWVYAGSNPDYRAIAGSYPDWWLETNSSANNDLLLAWVDANSVTQSLSTGIVAGLSLNTGWNHVAVTYHRGTTTARIYTGGVLRATSTSAVLNLTNSGTFGLGTTGGDSTSLPLNGLLSYAVLLPAAAPADFIATLATPTSAPPVFPYLLAGGDHTLGGGTQTVRGQVTGDIEVAQDNGSLIYSVPFRLREK